jgi:hypothetical protein
MELTGKCKKAFEHWFNEEQVFDLGDIYNGFYGMQPSSQYGIYIDFFDSAGFAISLEQWKYQHFFTYKIIFMNEIVVNKLLQRRPDARVLAIQKANELYNTN